MKGKYFVIWGEDTYRSSRYKQELVKRFSVKTGSDLNYSQIDGRQADLDEIVNSISARPLLAESRFVIINNLLLSEREEEFEEKLQQALSNLPEESVVAFFEEGVPKNTKLLRALMTEKNSRKFDHLEGHTLSRWILDYVASNGGQIEAREIREIIAILSNDLWAITNELDKLLAFEKKITLSSIEKLVAKPLNPSIFGLLDAAIAGRKEEAYAVLDDLLAAGESEMAILGMLGKQVRDLALVKSFPEETRENEIARVTKIHPYGVKKARSAASRIDAERIGRMYDVLERTDRKIRTGELTGPLALNFLISEF